MKLSKKLVFDYYLFPDLKEKFQKDTLDLLKINPKKDYQVEFTGIFMLII